jgi:hypothetical protein
VDAASRIYVAEEGNGSVSIFSADWAPLGKLGQGNGEFRLPNHIAVAPGAAGQIYVSDSLANVIKVYGSDGTFQKTIGAPGRFNGQFDFPAGLHATASGELFVADQNNGRVQVFSMEGVYLRSFGRGGGMLGGSSLFGRLQGITGDSQGRLYLADAFNGSVRIVNGSGTPLATLGAFGDRLGELRGPASMALDRNNRMFIVSTGNTRVEVFGLDAFIDPKTLQAQVSLRPSTFEREEDDDEDDHERGAQKAKSGQGEGGKVKGLVKVPGFDPARIDSASITANDVPAQAPKGLAIADFDEDGIPELKVEFPKKAFLATLPMGPSLVRVAGRLSTGETFESSVPVTVKTEDDDAEDEHGKSHGSAATLPARNRTKGGAR